MAIRVPWDEYETVILLDAFLSVQRGEIPRKEAIEKVSKMLRKKAILSGIEIDDIYRNINGIQMQMGSIQYIYTGGRLGLPHKTKLFENIVQLYKTDKNGYTKLLKEAKSMIDESKSGESHFFVWLSSKVAESQLSVLYLAYSIVDDFCTKVKILSSPLLETTDDEVLSKVMKTINRHKVFRIKYKKLLNKVDIAMKYYFDYLKETKAKKESTVVSQINNNDGGISNRTDHIITYQEKVDVKRRGQMNSSQNYKEKNGIINFQLEANVAKIVSEGFTNGIRLTSKIEHNKLKNIYNQKMGKEFPENIEISGLLKLIGVEYNEKVYVYSDSHKSDIIQLIDTAIANGNRLFFYEELYRVNAEFFNDLNVNAPEVLCNVLKSIFPLYFFSKHYFSIESNVDLESELVKCFETNITLTYSQIQSVLQYVPIDRIKAELSRSNKFVWVRLEEFALVDKISFDENELQNIINYVNVEIEEKGFASVVNFIIDNAVGLNPNVSESAIREAVYLKALQDAYVKTGYVITPKGESLNTFSVLEEYCNSVTEASLEELLDYETEHFGENHRTIIYAAFNKLVRVEKNRFVNDALIQIDVEATDRALELFSQGRIIPVTSVTSFTSFPHIEGYTWNLYLLESYCKRFSRKFSIDGAPAKSRNIGAIYPKYMQFNSYNDILAKVIAETSLVLFEQEVGDFLSDNSFIARRSAPMIRDVIDKAVALRNQGG